MEENEEYPWRPGPNHNPELGNKKGNDMVIKDDIRKSQEVSLS